MDKQIIDGAIKIIQPVWESAVILAGEYSTKCGRGILTGEDFKYALKFCAINMTGKHNGTLFPELEEEDDDSDSDEEEEGEEEVDESDDPFTRYQGDDELMNKINTAVDGWDEWEPATPIEQLLKEAVNKND